MEPAYSTLDYKVEAHDLACHVTYRDPFVNLARMRYSGFYWDKYVQRHPEPPAWLATLARKMEIAMSREEKSAYQKA